MGYSFVSLAIGIFIAFPPILLLGGLLNEFTPRNKIFGHPIVIGSIGGGCGATIIFAIIYGIRPVGQGDFALANFAGDLLFGTLCGIFASLLFRKLAKIGISPIAMQAGVDGQNPHH